mmetsp:Transcript_24089/g.26360  ORF Transcript_24089/g.26360 Transcript_24089/m.26360 type:complete len:158 (+) Transcript_24089:114-587(+)
MASRKIEVPIATVVEDPIKRIQVPPNCKAGDSFIVTDYGVPFTVIVPEGATPGAYLNVVVPQEATVVGADDTNTQNTRGKLKIDKAVAGAAILGVVVGTLVAGPIIGVIAAGGAAFAASQKDGDISKTVRDVGKKTYDGLNSAKKWVEKRIHCVDGR